LPKVHADDSHEPLQVTFHGGLYNHQPQKASFQFHCEHDVNEPTFPKFSWQFNGTHSFTWRSKHACPRALPPGAPAPPPDEPDIDPPAMPPNDPDAGVGDPEPATGPPRLSTPFTKPGVAILGVALFFFRAPVVVPLESTSLACKESLKQQGLQTIPLEFSSVGERRETRGV